MVAMDRSGAEVDRVMPALNADTIAETLGPVLAKDAILCTDGLNSYKAFSKKAGVEHKPLNLSAGIRVVEGVFHIQHVNAYHHRLKGWMTGFHGVATRYLKNYLGWRRLLETHPASLNPSSVLIAALGGINHQ